MTFGNVPYGTALEIFGPHVMVKGLGVPDLTIAEWYARHPRPVHWLAAAMSREAHAAD